MAYAVLQSSDLEALRATVEFAPLGMAHFDAHGRILLVNRRLCEMLGYTRDELMRRDFLQLTFHEDVAECGAMIARLAAGEIPFFREEKRFVRADGSIVWSCVTVSAAPEVEGRAPFFIGIAEDITLKRERDAELAALANAIPQMVWISDSFGRRSWFNNRWYEYTGLAFEDVRELGWQRVHHPDHRERVAAGLMACLARGEIWEDTFPLRRFDGEYRWFLSRAVPVRDEAGTVIRWFGSNTDVTDHLDALRTAERARKQREEMVAAVAHDLRNPVHTIVLAAATLETPALADERRTRLAGIVKNTSLRMGRLLDDLLDFSRMESGTFAVHRAPVACASLLASMVELFEARAVGSGISLRVEHAPGELQVYGDRDRLLQVLSNLVGNSLKFTPAGGCITISCTPCAAGVEFTVADTGKGMTEEDLPRLFDRHWRADPGAPGGAGLGMPIVRGIVEAHGGEIGAQSAPGLGTTIRFTIPTDHLPCIAASSPGT